MELSPFFTAKKSRLLHKMGFENVESKSAMDLFWDMAGFRKIAGQVSAAFSEVGISVDRSLGCVDNRYYRGGKEISRQDAFEYLAKKTGKTLPEIDY